MWVLLVGVGWIGEGGLVYIVLGCEGSTIGGEGIEKSVVLGRRSLLAGTGGLGLWIATFGAADLIPLGVKSFVEIFPGPAA